jgi:hypothetical protein
MTSTSLRVNYLCGHEHNALILSLVATAAICFAGDDFLAGGTFVRNASNGTALNSIDATGKSDKLAVIPGKTYGGDNMLEFITGTNQTLEVQLSSGALVKAYELSEFRVDLFSSQIANADAQPEIIKPLDTTLNLALMTGDALIAVPYNASSNSTCLIQTQLANIMLNDSKVLVKANSKFVIAYVIEGKIEVLSPKSLNKKEEIQQGQMAFIVPFPNDIGVMITSKAIEPRRVAEADEHGERA